MVTGGIDIGNETVKAVIMDDRVMMSSEVRGFGSQDAVTVGERALEAAMEKAGISRDHLRCVMATGLAGVSMTLVDEYMSEPMCIAMGGAYADPKVKTILDMGGMKSIAIRSDGRGYAVKIARNDNCASGTGKYLTMICKVLGIAIEEMADLALLSKEDIDVQSTCTVFAESEVISLLHEKKKPEDIARGALRGLAKRLHPLILSVGIDGGVMLSGGVAQNPLLVAEFQRKLGTNIMVLEGPREIAAIGAALIAQQRMKS